MCCVHGIIADHHVVVALFLHQHSQYDALAAMMQLHILNEDNMATSN
jgi:hypothetical protein